MSVLVVAEHLRGQIRPITLELVSAAKELEEETVVAVIGKDPAAIADQVDVEGVTEIVTMQVEQEEFENDVYREAVEQLIADRSRASSSWASRSTPWASRPHSPRSSAWDSPLTSSRSPARAATSSHSAPSTARRSTQKSSSLGMSACSS